MADGSVALFLAAPLNSDDAGDLVWREKVWSHDVGREYGGGVFAYCPFIEFPSVFVGSLPLHGCEVRDLLDDHLYPVGDEKLIGARKGVC